MIYLICNILSILSLSAMGFIIYHGLTYDIFNESVIQDYQNHLEWAFATIFLYAFTISLVMFYFIGSGKRVKELIVYYKLDKKEYDKVLNIKRTFFPPITINLVLVCTAFFLFGAVDALKINKWWYHSFSFIGFLHYAYVFYLQLFAFKEDVDILESIGKQIDKNGN